MYSLSIGIAVLNGAQHIRGLLESLRSKYHSEMQIIILDGGSVDGSQAIIEEYEDIISHFESKPDGGIYEAYNSIRDIASGEYLLYLGCDDIYLFDIKRDKTLFSNKEVIYYGNVLMTTSGNIYDGRFSKLKIIRKNICHQAIFYPKLVYKKFSYDLMYPALSDYEYNLRLMRDGYTFSYFNGLVAIFSSEGISSKGDKIFNNNKWKIVLHYFGLAFAVYFLLYKVVSFISKIHRIKNNQAPGLKKIANNITAE